MPYKGCELVTHYWFPQETDDLYYAMITKPNAWSYYDNYCFKIIPSNQLAYFQVSFKPTLYLYAARQALFERSITMDYHYEIEEMKNIKTYILMSGKAAHEEFIKAFKQYETYTSMAVFEPTYSEDLLSQQLDLHLRASFFGNL
jgi:hypothetical protein